MKEFQTTWTLFTLTAFVLMNVSCAKNEASPSSAQPATAPTPAPANPPANTPANFDTSDTNPIINGKYVAQRTTLMQKSVVQIQLRTLTKSGGSEEYSWCSGVLIGPSTVLTAAHCFDNLMKTTVLYVNFSVNNERATNTSTPLFRRVLGWIRHPQYNSVVLTDNSTEMRFNNGKWAPAYTGKPAYAHDHDLTVVSFEGQAPKGFKPVAIDEDASANLAGIRAYMFGYGLNYDQGQPAPSKEVFLQNTALHFGVGVLDASFDVTSDHYLFDGSGPAFTCGGDSGGPDFVQDSTGTRVIGIHSTGGEGTYYPSNDPKIAPARACNGKTKSTRVAPFAAWVLSAESKLLKTAH